VATTIPPNISPGQCNPTNILANPFKIANDNIHHPHFLLNKNRLKAITKRKAACPEGKDAVDNPDISGSNSSAAKGLSDFKKFLNIEVIIPRDKRALKEINKKEKSFNFQSSRVKINQIKKNKIKKRRCFAKAITTISKNKNLPENSEINSNNAKFISLKKLNLY